MVFRIEKVSEGPIDVVLINSRKGSNLPIGQIPRINWYHLFFNDKPNIIAAGGDLPFIKRVLYKRFPL